MRTCFPSFPITPTFAFSSTCCSCCCRGVHTATPCDLKSPFRYARRGCPRLYSHGGASAAAVRPNFRRDTILPVQLRLHHRKVPTMVVQQPSLQHLRWVAIDPRRTPLVPRARCWSSSQPAHREQGPAPISSPMKLHRSLLFASSRVFVSPVQSARLPGSPRINGFHVFNWSPTG